MHKYRLLSKKGEGTFSEVLRAQCVKNGKFYAIKCMKTRFTNIEQVNGLREIQALRRLSPHPHIIKLFEVLYDEPTGRLALVFELMEMNIYEYIKGRQHHLPEPFVKSRMYQVLKGLEWMHRNGVFHRDIKPENILMHNDVLKLADFGSCRGIYSKMPYTEYISTRWYRAPECLLTDGFYTFKMDIWGIGCVLFEVVALFPLFPGQNEADQISKIHQILGTPPKLVLDKLRPHARSHDLDFEKVEGTGIEELIPHSSPECIDLIKQLLTYDPDARLTAKQAMKHPFFKEVRDAEKMKKAPPAHADRSAMEVKSSTKDKEREPQEESSEEAGEQDELTKAQEEPSNKMKDGSEPRRRKDEARQNLPNIKMEPSAQPEASHVPSVEVAAIPLKQRKASVKKERQSRKIVKQEELAAVAALPPIQVGSLRPEQAKESNTSPNKRASLVKEEKEKGVDTEKGPKKGVSSKDQESKSLTTESTAKGAGKGVMKGDPSAMPLPMPSRTIITLAIDGNNVVQPLKKKKHNRNPHHLDPA